MPVPRYNPNESQEVLHALKVPLDVYDGVPIHTFTIVPFRCQTLRTSIHPGKPGSLMRLQCTEEQGHVGRTHFFHAPTNSK